MECETKRHASDWPHFNLCHSLKNAKFSKKVFLVDRFRNGATIEAARCAALLQRGRFGAGFSILDLINSIPSHIQIDSCYSQAPAWRHSNPELRAIFYQLAMLQQAEQNDQQLTPFSLNLTPELTNKAFKHKGGFIDYTKRQLDKAFKSVLNRKLQYWFVVEFDPVLGGYTNGNQRPHLHGAILISEFEKKSVNKQKTPISVAFHRAIGKCSPDFSNRLLHLGSHKVNAEQKGVSELEAAINWPGYCLKNNGFARRYLNSKGNLTADNATKSQAEALYALLRTEASKSPVL